MAFASSHICLAHSATYLSAMMSLCPVSPVTSYFCSYCTNSCHFHITLSAAPFFFSPSFSLLFQSMMKKTCGQACIAVYAQNSGFYLELFRSATTKASWIKIKFLSAPEMFLSDIIQAPVRSLDYEKQYQVLSLPSQFKVKSLKIGKKKIFFFYNLIQDL